MRPTSDHDERTLDRSPARSLGPARRLLGAARLSVGGPGIRARADGRAAALRARDSCASTCTCRTAATTARSATSRSGSAPAQTPWRATSARSRRELEWVEPGTPLSQLFVGGGTPTALPAELLDEMLERIFARARPDGSGVHTVETSPETISPAAHRRAEAARHRAGEHGHPEPRRGGARHRAPPADARAGARRVRAARRLRARW